MTKEPERGWLIVGHGTRETEGVREFLALVDRLRVPGRIIEPCFLELAEPTIAAGVDRLVEQGVRSIVAVPLLLFAAGHVRRDIPRALEAAVNRHIGVAAVLASHLGCHRRIVELSSLRYRESLEGREAVSEAESVLLLVGRGSRDPGATREMHCFTELRGKSTPVGRLEVGFLAMARPTFDESLARVAALRPRRIVVQPHLLWPGVLMNEVRHKVARWSTTCPDIEWVVAEPVGNARELAEAVAEIAQNAGGTRTGQSQVA